MYLLTWHVFWTRPDDSFDEDLSLEKNSYLLGTVRSSFRIKRNKINGVIEKFMFYFVGI